MSEVLYIVQNNSIEHITDTPILLDCPHCNKSVNIVAISFPRFQFVWRFQPPRVGIFYMCPACKEPIPLKFDVKMYDPHNATVVHFKPGYTTIEKSKISFEFEYLPDEEDGKKVKSDFEEALDCYANDNFNAFGSMCRRTIQSAMTQLGAKGKASVERQVQQAKDMGVLEDDTDETDESLEQIILGGHDGSHPNLPTLNKGRAKLLLALIKDVLYQLYVRPGQIKEAKGLRSKSIAEKNED